MSEEQYRDMLSEKREKFNTGESVGSQRRIFSSSQSNDNSSSQSGNQGNVSYQYQSSAGLQQQQKGGSYSSSGQQPSRTKIQPSSQQNSSSRDRNTAGVGPSYGVTADPNSQGNRGSGGTSNSNSTTSLSTRAQQYTLQTQNPSQNSSSLQSLNPVTSYAGTQLVKERENFRQAREHVSGYPNDGPTTVMQKGGSSSGRNLDHVQNLRPYNSSTSSQGSQQQQGSASVLKESYVSGRDRTQNNRHSSTSSNYNQEGAHNQAQIVQQGHQNGASTGNSRNSDRQRISPADSLYDGRSSPSEQQAYSASDQQQRSVHGSSSRAAKAVELSRDNRYREIQDNLNAGGQSSQQRQQSHSSNNEHQNAGSTRSQQQHRSSPNQLQEPVSEPKPLDRSADMSPSVHDRSGNTERSNPMRRSGQMSSEYCF